MFTGIIERQAELIDIRKDAENKIFIVQNVFGDDISIGQSIAHDGVCLTIEKCNPKTYQVSVIQETLKKSNLGTLKIGHCFNTERSMPVNGRFEGHIVQGHVDTTAKIVDIKHYGNSWEYTFAFLSACKGRVVEKGSIAINGVSLTCYDVQNQQAKVAIIPHTYNITNIGSYSIGDLVNIEFDIIIKYLKNMYKFED